MQSYTLVGVVSSMSVEHNAAWGVLARDLNKPSVEFSIRNHGLVRQMKDFGHEARVNLFGHFIKGVFHVLDVSESKSSPEQLARAKHTKARREENARAQLSMF